MAENSITSVQVALRIRPLVDSETSSGCQKILETISNEPQVIVKNTDKSFTFNHVFDADVAQEQFYEKAVKNMVGSLFKGYNVTILAYGQTGSGKTHTMGTCYTEGQEMGVIPRAVNDIFREIEKNSESDFRVSVSFMELYQESLYDLLADRPREQCIVDIREDTKGIRVPGLTEQVVMTADDTTKCLIQGSQGRATGATAMNAQSSRSHAIFTICIQQQHRADENTAMSSKFHLVDLAGSERPKKTKATGERFKEGVKINQGLLALGNVISALGDDNQKAGYICYRDSKLTRLLQDSLGGNSITLMIACVSPADYNLDETISTLRYADRARKIKNKPIINQDPKAALIARLNHQVHQLQLQLLEQGGSSTSAAEFQQLRAENDKLQLKNRKLTEQLQEAISENTCMYERALITENANEKLQQKLEELKQECDVTFQKLNLTDEQANIYRLVQEKIEDVKSQQQRAETEVLNHDIKENRQIDNIGDGALYFDSQTNFDMKQESHTMQQLAFNNQLQELSRALALKEQLASQIQANSMNMVDYNAMQENESKIQALEKEKNELLLQLKTAQNTNVSSKLSEQRRQRVQELENLINELNRKLKEQARLIKLKEKDDIKIKQLNNEIFGMKQAKVKLVKMMRTEADKYRQWKMAREREVTKLKDQDRKRQNQMIRMENMHAKQQTVLKRKVEEAAAINKRLKDALALQKSAQERRGQTHGKAERIQQWVSQDLEVLVSTVEAERTLDHLIEERKLVVSQREELLKEERTTPDYHEQLRELDEDIELRSTQITDIKQKIIDSDQENKAKTRWDMVQTMIEAKIALKYLFELTADIKRKEMSLDLQHQEEICDLKEKLTNTESKLREFIKEHDQQIAQLEKDHEEKVSILLHQMNGGGDGLDVPFGRKYYAPEYDKELMALKMEVEDYKTKCADLSQKLELFEKGKTRSLPTSRRDSIFDLNPIADQSPSLALGTCDTTIEEIDNVETDPDWRITPVVKRLPAMKRQRVSDNDTTEPAVAIKRTSGGSMRCTCKGNCRTKQCGCKKMGSLCSKTCKCENRCKNKENSYDDSDSNDASEQCSEEDKSIKQSRTFFQPADINTTFVKRETKFFGPDIGRL